MNTNSVVWHVAEKRPEHRQEILMLCAGGAVALGFFVDPDQSGSTLTGFCKWNDRGSHAVGVGFVKKWTPLEDLLPKEDDQ